MRGKIPMRARLRVILGLFVAIIVSNFVLADPFPQLLPDAGNFELTVREDSRSSLPLGAACASDAAVTLACRAFVVSLKNVGRQTVHLSRIACQEWVVSFEVSEPSSSSGWWTISQVQRPHCTPWVYENIRLRPGETAKYRTRLVSENRPADLLMRVEPRSYTVRARWLLWGCTEDPQHRDCMAPLQVMQANSWGGPRTGQVELQTPVEVISKAIEVHSPALPDFGPLKLGFEISVAPRPNAEEMRKRFGYSCATGPEISMECTVFHYGIRNLGDRPVRNGRYSCMDFSIIPEYRTSDGEWKQLQSRLASCTMNIYFETAILPGKAAEGDFTLRTLGPQYDTSPLYTAGRYEVRFGFHSSACFASSDGSFCIQSPREQIAVASNLVTINATAFTANGVSAK